MSNKLKMASDNFKIGLLTKNNYDSKEKIIYIIKYINR